MRSTVTMLFWAFVSLGLGILGPALQAGPAYGQASSQTCQGFMVLPNGYAVLSGLDIEKEMAGHQMHQMAGMKRSEAKGEMKRSQEHGEKSHKKMEEGHKKMASGERPYLLGYRHGQDISPDKPGMLCVPLHGRDREQWNTVSLDPSLDVVATSLRGKLTHNSRANEGFELQVTRQGRPVEGAKVVFLVRMPHHDRYMPGGHGLANDPDVEGLEAEPSGDGRYVIFTTDFTMPGAWLFEIRIMEGNETTRAYFATRVGEE